MKPLNLEPFQATALQENRLGAVLVEMNPQPITVDKQYNCPIGLPDAPFTPGEAVELIEQLKTLSRHIADATITARVSVYLPELTEDQAKVLGASCNSVAAWDSEAIYADEPYRFAVEHGHRADIRQHWLSHPGRVWDCWAWLVRFDTQQKGA